MSYTVNEAFVTAQHAMLHHLQSQKRSKLRGLFKEEQGSGDTHKFDRIATLDSSEITNLGEDIAYSSGEFSVRHAVIKGHDAHIWVSDIEKIKMLLDPTNDLAMEIMGALGRKFDDMLISAMLGTAITGRDQGGTESFDTSNNQIAHGSTGLTVAKVLQSLRILEENDVDPYMQNVYLLLSPKGKEDLLNDSNFTSSDYQDYKALAGKSLPTFRGIQIVETNRLPAETAGSVYRSLLVTDNAMKVANASHKASVSIDKIPGKKDQPFLIYAKDYFGAVRMEESLIVDILFQ